jgi:hypothetical protein
VTAVSHQPPSSHRSSAIKLNQTKIRKIEITQPPNSTQPTQQAQQATASSRPAHLNDFPFCRHPPSSQQPLILLLIPNAPVSPLLPSRISSSVEGQCNSSKLIIFRKNAMIFNYWLSALSSACRDAGWLSRMSSFSLRCPMASTTFTGVMQNQNLLSEVTRLLRLAPARIHHVHGNKKKIPHPWK